MKYFLVIYDRAQGHLESIEEFEDFSVAAKRRLATELMHRRDSNIEIVVLGADSRSDIEKTHSRYFKSENELALQLLRRVQLA
jgi:hypothetical protein